MAIEEVIPKMDVSKFRGEWIVICDKKLVAHNKDLTKIKKEIGQCKKMPTVTKIPKEETLIF